MKESCCICNEPTQWDYYCDVDDPDYDPNANYYQGDDWYLKCEDCSSDADTEETSPDDPTELSFDELTMEIDEENEEDLCLRVFEGE